MQEIKLTEKIVEECVRIQGHTTDPKTSRFPHLSEALSPGMEAAIPPPAESPCALASLLYVPDIT